MPQQVDEPLHYSVGSRIKQDVMLNYQIIDDEIVFHLKYRPCAMSQQEAIRFCRELSQFLRRYLRDR